jgi:hypothetical protein
MEQIKQKMEHARRQRKRLQENPQDTTEFSSVGRKPTLTIKKLRQHLTISHNTSLFLWGTAAVVTIAVMTLWAKSVWTPVDSSMIALETTENMQVRQAAGTQPRSPDFQTPSDNITHLNERVELLTDNITNLEAQLMRVLVLAESITALENNFVSAARQHNPVISGTKPVFDTMEPTASGVARAIPDMDEVFTPTHTVQAKLNLRPSASLNATPIAVLKVGSKVEYISESGDWYYVNTQSHGTGWCSSSYLSPSL